MIEEPQKSPHLVISSSPIADVDIESVELSIKRRALFECEKKTFKLVLISIKISS